MKKWIKRLLMSLVGIVLFFWASAYVVLFSPHVIPPKIGDDLPSNFREAEQVFKERVQNELGGLSVDALRQELKRQGFRVNDHPWDHGGWSANFTKSSFPCELIWRINWHEVDGKVDDLFALYGGRCL